MSAPSPSPSGFFSYKSSKACRFLGDDNDKFMLVGAQGSVTRLRFSRWNSAPTANRCDVTAIPHAKCLQDPLIPETTAPNSPLMYSLLCDDDCQLRCDSVLHPLLQSPLAFCISPAIPKRCIHRCVYRSMCIHTHTLRVSVCLSVFLYLCLCFV